MRTHLSFMLMAVAALSFGQSPITIGNSNMPGSGDTLRYTNIQLSSLGNYTQTGTNFTWNFSSVVSTSEGVRSFKSGLQTPYALFFLSLNEYGEKIADTIGAGPFVITKYYNYYKKQTSPAAFIADGAGVTFSSVPLPSYYSDKDELYNFPMSYPKYDSTSFKFSTLTTTLIPIRYSKSGFRATRVDGWGTVTTPYGTDVCLRLVTTQYSMDSIKTTLGPVVIPFGFPNNVRSYQWMTATSKIPFMEVTGNLIGNTFTPTQARYRGYEKPVSTVGLNELDRSGARLLFPNPVKDRVSFNAGNEATGQVMIFDAQGRLLKTEQPEVTGALSTLDVSGLEPGIYFIRVGVENEAAHYKFIKQ